MTTATGTYFNGQEARGRAVTIEFAESGALRIIGENLAEEIALAQIRVSDRLGDVPRFIYLPGEAVIETPDNAIVDAALGERQQSRGSRLIHRLESQQRVAAVACLLVLAAIAALGYFGPPVLARVVAQRVPPEIDQRIGTAALATIKPYFSDSSLGARERERVQKQLARLSPAGATTPHPRLEFRAMNGGLPNAFALPGNVIIVTDELVRLPASDDEIAAVLAHELGHLEKRHGLQSLLRGSFAVLIVAAVTGDLSALTSFAGTIPMTILTAGYSRELEREADHYALALLRTRGIAPRAFTTALVKLEASQASLNRNSTYVSTHPATEERIALFGALTAAERKLVLAGPSVERGEAAARRHDHRAAITAYTAALELSPSAHVYLLRARSYYALAEHANAEDDIKRLLLSEPNSFEALALRTEILALGRRKYDEAIIAAKAALALRPKDAPLMALLGYAETLNGDAAGAADLDRAIEMDRLDYRGWAYRAYTKEAHNDLSGALADYNEAVKRDPDVEWVHLDRGFVRNRQKDYTGALADFAAVTDPTRKTAQFYLECGNAESGLSRFSTAIADYTRALESNPARDFQTRLHLNRANAYSRTGDFRLALTDVDAAIALAPNYGPAYVQRAFAHRRLGNLTQALIDLERATKAGAPALAVLRERAITDWDLGHYREASQEYTRIIEQEPDARSYQARGLIAFSAGDPAKAEADLNACLKMTPSRPGEYAEFFRLLARRRQQTDEQPAAFIATVAAWPNGWAKSVGNYLSGKMSESALLAEARAGAPPAENERFCEAYYYAGITRLFAGDTAHATELFEKCLRTGAIDFYEYRLARAELVRLRPDSPALSLPPPTVASSAPALVSHAPTSVDAQPVPLFQALPNYPTAMLQQNIQGEVFVDFLVDEKGDVQNPYVIRSSRPEFEAPAVEAVRQWKFRPGRKDSRPVSTHLQVPVTFNLQETDTRPVSPSSRGSISK